MFVREEWNLCQVEDLQERYVKEGLEVIVATIALQRPSRTVTLVGAYRPPSAPNSWFQKLDQLIIEVMAKGPLILLGDINADLLKPTAGPSKLLRKALALGGLKVNKVSPTRVCETTSTCLDIIAASKDLECIEYRVIPYAASDHFLVEARFAAESKTRPRPIMRRSFKRVNMNTLRQKASNIVLPDSKTTSPDDQLQHWNQSMTDILDEMAPFKNYPEVRKKCKWLTADVRALMLRRDALAREIVDQPTKALVDECNKLRRMVKGRMRRAAREYGSTVLTEGDSSGAWEFIREATFSTNKGQRVSMDLDVLNEALAKTVTRSGTEDLAIIQTCDTEKSLQLQPLRTSVVRQMMAGMKTKTATGPDGLSATLLKNLAPAIAPNLTTIMNRSLEEGVFPAEWKRANVAAIWKSKGSKSDPANYRPISVLPVLARLFEKIVAKELSTYCYGNNIVPEEQYGFRSKSSCETALVAATDKWMGEVDQGKIVGALLIDLSKAFDTVPHQRLLEDLREIGCGQKLGNWFHSYLDGREQRVKNGLEVTEWKSVTRGVPQGSCLSPLLFNIYVRNLPAASTSPTIQFADDVTQSESDRDELQVINRLTVSFLKTKDFCEQRELIINSAKTQFIIFKAPRRKISLELEIVLDGITIKPALHVKLLGVTLDRHFTFGEHIDKAVKKARGAIGMLARAAPHMPRELLRLAYIALARSHLEYASAVYASASDTQLKKLDTTQKIASRVICRAPRDCHSEPLLAMLKLDSLGSRREEHVCKLVAAILEGNCHPSLTTMFEREDAGLWDGESMVREESGEERGGGMVEGRAGGGELDRAGLDGSRGGEGGLRGNGRVWNTVAARTSIGKKRISIYAKDLYNSRGAPQNVSLAG